MEPDRISCLPRVVVDQILSRLPLREAVRTSVLSSEWRYKWTTLPDIVIDSLCVSEDDDSVVGDKLARIIDNVLSLHSGQINKFEISYKDLTKDLTGSIGSDRWALNLSRSSVNEFVWNIIDGVGQRYRIPSCLFACQRLVRLQLCGCLLEPPSTFLGFRVLKSLILEDVILAQDVFESLISSCPLLERMKLSGFDGFNPINIDAPNLWYLDIKGVFEDVSFKNTFHLAEISIHLTLNFEGSIVEHYRMPYCFFACQSLVRLQLYSCSLEPPSTFLGFRVLQSLILEDVILAQDVFENLISSCPLLERLKLWAFHGFNHLNIEALNLRYLDILGGFEDVSFKNTFHLAEISIYLSLNFEGSVERSSNLLKFFDHLHHVRRLEFSGIFLKYLAMGIVPLKLPKPCIDLNYLEMCINFKDSKEVSAALCLLRSSPNLQELRIVSCFEVWPVPGTHLYSWEDHRSCPFMQLRFVWIECITGTKPELDFIRFLLTDSPVLERMTVAPDLKSGGEFLPIELLRLRRASASAEVVYIYS